VVGGSNERSWGIAQRGTKVPLSEIEEFLTLELMNRGRVSIQERLTANTGLPEFSVESAEGRLGSIRGSPDWASPDWASPDWANPDWANPDWAWTVCCPASK
jgi:hypothetical protein